MTTLATGADVAAATRRPLPVGAALRAAAGDVYRQSWRLAILNTAFAGAAVAVVLAAVAWLPLLALSFLLLAPLFIWFAPDTTRRELTDFVGQKVG